MSTRCLWCCLVWLAAPAVLAQAPDTTQATLPYYEIPAYPSAYTAGNVVGRMLDGLGYRYYWATESLRQEDLAYRPSAEARSLGETIDHLYGLSETIVNAPQSQPNVRPADWSGLTFAQKRRATLENIEQASLLVKAGGANEMETYQAIFERPNQTFTFPFWNMLNGPIADALYHVGQVVSFRRTAGNPIPPGVNVFTGKTRE